MLVFPDQPLSPDDEMRAIQIFHPDIADADNGWGLNLPGYPKILLLSNVVEEGEPIGFHNKIGMGWHIDGVRLGSAELRVVAVLRRAAGHRIRHVVRVDHARATTCCPAR